MESNAAMLHTEGDWDTNRTLFILQLVLRVMSSHLSLRICVCT